MVKLRTRLESPALNREFAQGVRGIELIFAALAAASVYRRVSPHWSRQRNH